MKTLKDLFVHELKDLYDAEHQLVEALPAMAEAASSTELSTAFKDHLKATKGHITRLEQVFETVNEKPSREACAGMKGLIKEGQKVMEEDMSETVRDAALIAAAQRAEHYEMAGYGTLRTYAHLIGESEAAQLLQRTLDEEDMTDKHLSKLAHNINEAALA
jgi:ferritin-like metal-binding protein YciE